MQIDFHHAVTYVIARTAGFGHREAETIAYCAQYVDDATNAGIIRFENKALYSRVSSAHKMLDYRNFAELANHHVWIPFHFLPGNDGNPAGVDTGAAFAEKIVCRPNSPVAQDMVRSCIEDQETPYGLHRLGITMHVFADTWAHQGFAGINNEVNDIEGLDDEDQPDAGLREKLIDFFKDRLDLRTGRLLGNTMPLGHGAALSYPDRPFLRWRYRDHKGNIVERDNPRDFLEAAEEMCKAMQRYRLGDPDATVSGLPDGVREKIDTLFRSITDTDGDERHKQWLKHIAAGDFGFPSVRLEYRAKGLGSWKHQALGTRRSKDKKGEVFPYDPSFLRSDWKMFHDAMQAHRFIVLHDILPRFGICAA